MKTLKKEEIHCRKYGSLEELQNNLEVFLDTYYNHHRLHSALAYKSPAEYEEELLARGQAIGTEAAKMSFFGHKKSSAPIRKVV